MKTFAAVAVLATLASSVASLTVNTPANVVQCEPIQFVWKDGTPPYFLSLLPGGQPTAPALKQFPQQSQTALTWIVDMQANTIFTISLKDNTGAQAFSDIVTIQSSTNTTCINTSIQDSGVPTGASGQATGSTGANPTSAAAGGSGGSGSSASKTSASTPAKTSNAGTRGATASAFGVAGLMGLVGAALL